MKSCRYTRAGSPSAYAKVDVGRPMARDCRKMGIHRDTVRGGPGLLRQR